MNKKAVNNQLEKHSTEYLIALNSIYLDPFDFSSILNGIIWAFIICDTFGSQRKTRECHVILWRYTKSNEFDKIEKILNLVEAGNKNKNVTFVIVR